MTSADGDMRRFLGLFFVLVTFAFLNNVSAATAVTAGTSPVLVLGDSLSAAHGIARDAGWVNLLQQRVTPRRVVNASISGETTSGGLARLPLLLAEHEPNLVLLELGANDGLRGLPLDEIRANLVQMLTLIRAAKARPVLIGIELPINYGPQYRDGLRKLYRDLAGEFNVPLVPFLLEGVALDPALMQDDALHPNAQGQPRLLETVWSVIKSEF
jgi:acyl-CoA thioesterase-1